MRSVGVNTNVPTTKGLAELNHHKRDELKEVRNGTAFDGQGLSEEDESRINEDVNSGRRIELGQIHDALHRHRQQPQGSTVQWERFLPLRSLKVLLVEDDDSTRHVVSALLRNCSYEVTAVANGVEAWKVLMDLNKQIDLVLTEVVMPYISGIGLLSKITNHVTRKNTPVIMMSSDDSMGIVFNCLSKGAVDFLVKPIRKNELKNLWQHVWRKCYSSSGSGSGSESGIQTRKSTKSIRNEESDDESDNSDEDDDVSMDLDAKDGSDNGSGTQSSWSKRVIEVDSSQAQSLWEKLPDPRDAAVARPDTSKNIYSTKDDKDIAEMGKDLEIGVPKSSTFEAKDANKKSTGKFCESSSKKVCDKLDISMQLGGEKGAPRTEAVVGPTKITNGQSETVAKANNLLKNINLEDKNKNIYYSKESPTLELSLKRPRDVEDAENSAQERNVLRHSGVSAFSRYNTVSNVNTAPTGIVGSCSPLDISSEAAKPDNILSNSNGTPNQRSNGSDDMGSTTNNAFTTKPNTLTNDKPLPNSTTVVHHNHTTTLEPLEPCPVEADTVNTAVGPPNTAQQVQVRHHHHHYHHHHHHVHKLQQQKTVANNADMVSNVLIGEGEGDAANYGSASGSNNKSNGENGGSWQKGNSPALVADGGKIGSDNCVVRISDGGDGSGSGSGRGSGVDQDRLAQREAALMKFRQKRKERCFEKKVRYQSRKKLAEQRPRVRGQFVRHGANGINNEDADS